MVNSKQKGAKAEREVANILKTHGYDARRTAQYCGNTGDAADVVGMPGVHLEVKRQEKMYLHDWMEQSIRDTKDGSLPVVVHRKNNAEWLLTMRFEDFISLHKMLIEGEKNIESGNFNWKAH